MILEPKQRDHLHILRPFYVKTQRVMTRGRGERGVAGTSTTGARLSERARGPTVLHKLLSLSVVLLFFERTN